MFRRRERRVENNLIVNPNLPQLTFTPTTVFASDIELRPSLSSPVISVSAPGANWQRQYNVLGWSDDCMERTVRRQSQPVTRSATQVLRRYVIVIVLCMFYAFISYFIMCFMCGYLTVYQ